MKRWRLPLLLACLVLGALALGACGARQPGPETGRRGADSRAPQKVLGVEHGKATWYGGRFHGRKTASGERFDKHALTAAHKKLPFGTRVRVTNLRNGKTVIVRITDRGPYGKGRIIDVSEAAARKLDMIRAGVVDAKVEILSKPAR